MIRVLTTIAWMNTRRTAGGKQLILVLMFLLVPPLVLTLNAIFKTDMNATVLAREFPFASFHLYFYLILPAVTLLYASTSIVDEVEQQTLPYLMLQPIPKWTILLGKFIGFTLTAQFMLSLSMVAAYALPFLLAAPADILKHAGILWQLWWVSMICIWTYGAIFLAISLMTSRVFLIGFLYYNILEVVLSNVPTLLQKGSVLFYAKSLLRKHKEFAEVGGGMFFQEFIPPADYATSILVMSLYAGIALILGTWLIHVKEFIPFHIRKD